MNPKHNSEFDAFCARAADAAAIATAGLAEKDERSIESDYCSAVQFVTGVLAALMLEARDIGPALKLGPALREAADDGPWQTAKHAIGALGLSTHIDLFQAAAKSSPPSKYGRNALRSLLTAQEGFELGPIYFESCPAAWLSGLYERLIGLKPRLTKNPPGVTLISDSSGRKRSGSFFTPRYMVDYIVSEALGRIEAPAAARVLDQSMGAGDFLLRALDFLSNSPEVAENCLFGCDIDPAAVSIARFLVWLQTGGRADSRLISRHLVCADALAGESSFRWQDAFPDAFNLFAGPPGFDAVIGNPPYVAAKNGQLDDCRLAQGARGQTDYYLLFLENVLGSDLVRKGGRLAMVLPDPFLVRTNAAQVRRTLLRDWTFESVIHVSGAFPGAQVANIVLVCANEPSDGRPFPVVRLDKGAPRRRFELKPDLSILRDARMVSPAFALAQPGAEVLYLVDNERRRQVFQRIHGPEKSLSRIVPPFVFLKDLDVEMIFRGEEIGKGKIMAAEGEIPILLGGQSVHPYAITWEGRGIRREDVSKPMEWYAGPKILLQKSTDKLIAAYDEEGFVVPQSVYGIKLRPGGHHPLYLLAILNSSFMREYVFEAFTGYKLVQPQIELEDVKRLPIRTISLTMEAGWRAQLLNEGKRRFESCQAGPGGFSALAELTSSWLGVGSEHAVHDLLVYLAGLAIHARRDERIGPRVAERTDRAIDAVVETLYGF